MTRQPLPFETTNHRPPTAMTKADEMKTLDAFIASLPQESYLRPWLETERDGIETDLRNDIIPTCRPRTVFEQCESLKKGAAENAKRLTDDANKEAARIVHAAEKKAQRALAYARENLRQAVSQIGG